VFDLVPADELDAKKREFARHLIRRPNEPFKAAAYIYPDKVNVGNRLIVAHDWPDDPIVIMEMDRLIWDNEDVAKIMPTKNQIAFEVYSVGMRSNDDEAKIKAFKLYCDINGHTSNNTINIQNNNKTVGTQNSVMLIKDHGSNDTWEDKLLIQQHRLLNTDVDRPIEDATIINK
jgi:hypothetical protein